MLDTFCEEKGNIRNADPGANGIQGQIGTNREITPDGTDFYFKSTAGYVEGDRRVLRAR